MSEPTTIYTLDDVESTIIAAVTRTPNALNPTAPSDSIYGTECLYTGPDGSHCIAGQVLVDLGLPVPGYGDEQNLGVSILGLIEAEDDLAAAFTEEAVNRLAAAQSAFDACTARGEGWSTALGAFLDEG